MTEGYMVEEIVESLRHADPLFCKLQNHKPDGTVYQQCLCLTPVFNVDGETGTFDNTLQSFSISKKDNSTTARGATHGNVDSFLPCVSCLVSPALYEILSHEQRPKLSADTCSADLVSVLEVFEAVDRFPGGGEDA